MNEKKNPCKGCDYYFSDSSPMDLYQWDPYCHNYDENDYCPFREVINESSVDLIVGPEVFRV